MVINIEIQRSLALYKSVANVTKQIVESSETWFGNLKFSFTYVADFTLYSRQ